jgi:hypothetical protein
MIMKNPLKYIFAVLLIPVFFSCQEEKIQTFNIEDSSVCFNSTSVSFSLKGMTTETKVLEIPFRLVGRVADYERPVALKVIDADGNTAVEGSDFKIVKAVLDSGAMTGNIYIEVKKLSEANPKQVTTLSLGSNDYFRDGFPEYSKSRIEWSEEYVRPGLSVWRYWYTFMCHGYSKALHELYIQEFGEEFEHYTNSSLAARNDATLIYKSPAWWYAATRQFYSMVKAHDDANPSAPYMHSADYQLYRGYNQAVGQGTTPAKVPTILETLVVL